MSENSSIEWTDHTFNPWIGCTKVSPGCDHCYAERREDLRLHRVKWGAGQTRHRTKTWHEPVRWDAQRFVECMECHWRGESRAATLIENPPGFHPPVARARACPSCKTPMLKETRARVFCASLADVFDNEVSKGWREDLFALIHNTPNIDWLLLTKRIGNADRMIEDAIADMELSEHGPRWPWPNVWLGATIVNQEEADRDIPKLLATPARVRFLSIEPMLGPVDLRYLQPREPPTEIDALNGTHGVLRPHRGICDRLDWVIAGGESGPKARPAHPDWFRSLRDQCAAAGVPFLFKQWGEWAPDDGPGRDGSDPIFDGKGPCARLTAKGWEQSKNGFTMPLKRDGDDLEWLYRLGKRAAGRLLDGVQHDGFPA